MSDHLPECPCNEARYQRMEAPMYGLLCICDRLRACEQRVRMEDDDYAYVATQAEAGGRRRGWNDALDEARDAVAGMYLVEPDLVWDTPVSACVEAIDALRGER
jgi:hypothetical protein